MQQKLILAGSIVFALLAFFLSHKYIDAQRAKLYAGAKQIQVLAANTRLSKGSLIKPQDLQAKKEFESAVGRDIFEATEENLKRIYNRVLQRPLEPGEVLRWSDIDQTSQRYSSLAEAIPDNQRLRAIAIPVSADSAVANLITPFDHVDVIGSFTEIDPENPAVEKMTTRTILQNIDVLATGMDYNKGSPNRSSRLNRGYSTVTLAVTPREAELLVFILKTKGELSLALRRPNNNSVEAELPSVNFDHLNKVLEDLNQERTRSIRKQR